MTPIKLISSVFPTQADHHRLFPNKGTVDEVLEGLCTVCNLGKPLQGWRLPPKKELDSEPPVDVEEGLKGKGMHFLGLYHCDCKPEPPVATDITLFISRCWRTGEKLGLNPHHIIEVVLIHEAAHYITHLGVEPGRILVRIRQRRKQGRDRGFCAVGHVFLSAGECRSRETSVLRDPFAPFTNTVHHLG